MAILEGNELEGKIGDVGGYTVDINEHLKLKASVSIEIDLLAELKKAADKSESTLLKGVYKVVAGFFGDTAEAPAVTPVAGA